MFHSSCPYRYYFFYLGFLILPTSFCLAQCPEGPASGTATTVVDSRACTSPTSTSAVDQQPSSGGNQEQGANDSVKQQHDLMHSPSLERSFFSNFVRDQKNIWSSPFRLNRTDAFWAVPTAAVTAGLIHRDSYLFSKIKFSDVGSTSASFSDAGIFALGAGIGSFYVFGRMRGDDHARETGVLGVEAVANSLAVGSVLKYSLRRERPFVSGSTGAFFNGGDSFPSNHALIAWSAASVIAHEYPGIATKLGVYGLASAVSIARVTGRQHFPSDVIIGSALGWGIGRYTYRTHHNEDLPGEDIGRIQKSEPELEPESIASTDVPLDSWIYPAITRLAALGYVHSDFAGIRPWTRMECWRLVREAVQQIDVTDEPSPAAVALVQQLEKEFNREAESLETGQGAVRVESVYQRFLNVSGPPLNDGYHFGETVYNDYGRPLRQGFNTVSGMSISANKGPWAVYVRGEYQHSPSAPALTSQVASFIAATDGTPLQPLVPFNQVNRFRLLDTYITFQTANWQFSIGKQSKWWGPGESGALNYSNNAEPVPVMRISRVSPAVLPSFLGFLGPLRSEIFFGQLAGHKFVSSSAGYFSQPLSRQPLFHGGKLSFKPTPNFEFGVSVTTIFGGPGAPLTPKTFLRSLGLNNASPGQSNDPGDRRAGFDFKYRIPGLRNWLTLYNDSLADDEISPIGYPRRSAMQPGIYLAQFPKLSHLDLRAEGFYTDLPGLLPTGFFYYNFKFRSGFTNQGNLLGHPVGRQGSGFMLSSNYWFSAQNSLKFSYRNSNVSNQFLPGGGRIDDWRINLNWFVKGNVNLSSMIQYETWDFPIIAPAQKSNVTSSIQISFYPTSRNFKVKH